MEVKQVYFKDITHEGRKVCELPFIDVQETDVRVYYDPSAVGLGFDFYAVYKTGYECNEVTDKNEWDERYCRVECVFRGVAYSDGIRHLYYGDKVTDNFGYHYYPNLEVILAAILTLRELEKKYCTLDE
jgi:hypothetical protein